MPLALAIEDLHWADPSTRELIELLTKECSRVPLMLLCTARPEFRLTTEAGARLVSVRLNPLNGDNARAIVKEVAGQTSLPEATIKTVVERAGGVPLFVEELTIAVLESGGALLTGRQIPVTLRDSLMARLDRLGAARETLQLGSVLGIEFSYDLLLAIYPQGEDELRHHLRTLTDAELLYAHGQPPEARYRIKHALIRDAAYETLLKSRRREIHRTVAKILEEHFPETAASAPELLAHHYTEGGVTAEAVRYWRRAGKKAIERSANLEAISFFRRGLELVTSLAPGTDRTMEELRLQMAVSTPVAATKGYLDPEVEDASKRALELSREIGDSPQLFTVLGGLNSIYFNRGELEVALELGRRMLRLAEAQRNPEMLLWAHYSLGFSLHFRGILKLARYHLERSLAFYDPRKGGTYGFVQDPGPTATMLLAHVLYKLGYPDQALERTRQALAVARSLSHPFTTAWVLGFVGELYWRRGDKLAAQEVWEEMAALSTKQKIGRASCRERV